MRSVQLFGDEQTPSVQSAEVQHVPPSAHEPPSAAQLTAGASAQISMSSRFQLLTRCTLSLAISKPKRTRRFEALCSVISYWIDAQESSRTPGELPVCQIVCQELPLYTWMRFRMYGA